MGLREEAEKDLGLILEDRSMGFGWDISLRSPEGQDYDLIGFSQDISAAVDPETGLLISSRTASIALRRASLIAKGIDPAAIGDSSRKPWSVRFYDINGSQHIFKIVRTIPDRMLGCSTYILGAYDVI